jgi:hypothetical protein
MCAPSRSHHLVDVGVVDDAVAAAAVEVTER